MFVGPTQRPASSVSDRERWRSRRCTSPYAQYCSIRNFAEKSGRHNTTKSAKSYSPRRVPKWLERWLPLEQNFATGQAFGYSQCHALCHPVPGVVRLCNQKHRCRVGVSRFLVDECQVTGCAWCLLHVACSHQGFRRYVQGMNLIAAHCIVNGMTEEETFWMLAAIVERVCGGNFYDRHLRCAKGIVAGPSRRVRGACA